jgi:hypothetical protein
MEPEKSLLREFINGGWIIPLIGAAGMLARLLASNNKLSLFDHIKKILAAAIASSIAWFILEQTDLQSFYKAVIYGIVGVISPEVIQGVVKMAKKFEKNPEKYLTK